MPQFRPKLPNLGSRPTDAGSTQSLQPDHRAPDDPENTWPMAQAATSPVDARGPLEEAGGTGPVVTADPTPPAESIAQRGGTTLRRLRANSRPFLHMPTLNVPSRAAVESAARELLAGPVEAARQRLQNPRELSDRIAMGRAIWRDLVIGFAAQLGELNLGFTQLAALYALADSGTMTVADLADALGRSQSATSRLVEGLVQRQLIERNQDTEDRRQRTLTLTGRGQALLGIVDRARAQEFLSIVRPLPTAERALVGMGVAALSTHAISRRGRLIKQRPAR
jgi:DNA-binding MarR family transcriptional regulator